MGIRTLLDHLLISLVNSKRAQPSLPVASEPPNSLGIEIQPNGMHLPFEFDPASRLKHLAVLGATGSGKTNMVGQLIEADIASGRTVVVLDMRCDLLDKIVRYIAANPELIPSSRVDIIDLRHPEKSAGLNLFRASADPFSAALQMHAIIKSESDGWGVQIDETARYSLIALSVARRSLSDLPRLLTDAEFRNEVLSQGSDPAVGEFFSRFNALSEDRRQTLTLPVLNKVSPLLGHPAIRAVMDTQAPLDLPAVLDTPGRVLLCGLAADRLHGLAGTFGSLFVSAVENAVMQRVDIPEELRNPVHLYLDEFEHFASSAFESILAEGRRFRLGLTLSHQNIHQTSTRLRHVIANNAANRVYFHTGVIDGLELASELSRLGVEDPVQRLLTLPVGEALVVRQRQNARHVRFRQATDAEPSPEALTTLYKALAMRYADKQPPRQASPPSQVVSHVQPPRAGRTKR